MLHVLIAGLLLAAASTPLGNDGPPALASLSIVDGGRELLLQRACTSCADGALLIDVATRRHARVRVNNDAIVALGGDVTLDSLDVQLIRPLMPSIGLLLVRSTRGHEDGAALAARLAPWVRVGALRMAYPDLAFFMQVATVNVPPDDARYAGQYYLDDVHAEAAWRVTTGSPDVVIAVVDNGCDLVHPDLIDKLLPGFDAIDNDADPSWQAQQADYHGTACAGLAAASTDNGIGIAGACPECALTCARLLPAPNEPVPLSVDVETFAWLLQQDVDVASNSWGFVDAIPVPQALKEAIMQVAQRGRGGLGTVVVFAAGNDGREVLADELLAVPGIIGVGATTNIGELTQYTNTGAFVDVVAPIGQVALDISGASGDGPGDTLSTFSGTSSAAPIVSGIAALLVSAAPTLTADAIAAALTSTAKQSTLAHPDANGHDDGYGFGLIRADAALASVSAEGPPQADAPSTCAHRGANRAAHRGGAVALVIVAVIAARPRRGRR